MATAHPPRGALAVDDALASDPFVSTAQDAHRQRYSAFDDAHFSLYSTGSPTQTKRALHAHLAETTRRLQETSHLGNALVQQRKELEDRIRDVDKQPEQAEIGLDLRQRLAELEKEFNDVGRETARIFLPKSRVSSGEASDSTAAASVFSSESRHSPSKVSAPSRKQRNQQPSRINDIALATEISTSLLAQLRELQNVLLEKDDALKAANLDRSHLEIEVEGLSQRLRTIDESESRLKDVNWSLETQVRDLESVTKDAASKEHRLNQTLNSARSEKLTLERELEEIKQLYAKLNEDHSHYTRAQETELTGLRRNVSMGETERGALQRKIEDLKSQNEDLAKAVAYRIKTDEQNASRDTSPEDSGDEGHTLTPEHSPPPSPSKATPRYGQLESETLKHSLHHAHRMIQQLKNNIHREKTEKIELKRMLQDARDEIETSRNGMGTPGSASKKKRHDKDAFKKPARPDRLGVLRTSSRDVMLSDDEWEENDIQQTPTKRPKSGYVSAADASNNEGFHTANETEAFETANERGNATETDAFHTGAETLDGDSTDDLTETEGASSSSWKKKRPSPLVMAARNSFDSTASTSADEADAASARTTLRPQQPRYRLKLSKGGYRRASTPRGSTEVFVNSPSTAKASPASSNQSTPAQGKSLFAELANLEAESEDGSFAEGTPSRSSVFTQESSPEMTRKSIGKSPLQTIVPLKPPMVDSSMMTEPWTPLAPTAAGDRAQASLQPRMAEAGTSMDTAVQDALPVASRDSQTEPLALGVSPITIQVTEPVAAPAYAPELQRASIVSQQTEPVEHMVRVPELRRASIIAQRTEPVEQIMRLPELRRASIVTQRTDPVQQQVSAPPLQRTPIFAQLSEPMEPAPVPKPSTFSQDTQTDQVSLGLASLCSQATEPVEHAPNVSAAPMAVPDLRRSSIKALATEPVEAERDLHPAAFEALVHESVSTKTSLPLRRTSVLSQWTEPTPVVARQPTIASSATTQTEAVEAAPVAPVLAPILTQSTEPAPWPKRTSSRFSSVSVQSTEPVPGPKPAAPQMSSIFVQSTEPIAAPKSTLFDFDFSNINIQSTEPVASPQPAPPQFSSISSQSTDPSDFAEFDSIHGQAYSSALVRETRPESPTVPDLSPVPSRPSTAHRVPEVVLAYSDILAQEVALLESSRPTTSRRVVPDSGNTLSIYSDVAESSATSNDTAGAESERSLSYDGRHPLVPISSNAIKPAKAGGDVFAKPAKPMLDEGTQTMVSGEQIDNLLLAKPQRPAPLAAAGVEKPRLSPPSSPRRSISDANKAPRRPGSAASMRSRPSSPPPLPADHREVIAAASKTMPPAPQPSAPGSMGPPLWPASAYKKRPQTPVKPGDGQSIPGSRGGTTPRPRRQPMSEVVRSGATSPITRRSSVSSFASELDQRFNISQTGLPHDMDPRTTDSRIIEAITQTMVGDAMWKYTHNTRGNMSEHRHQRYFWVHPYTRTLYWSDQNPASKAPSRSKSVAIERVEVVVDDNPSPPGLHRKSLVVYTPGVTIKFTAPTSQRHDMWYNALTYLLRRTDEDPDQRAASDEIQNEFNPSFRSTSRQTGRSRPSMSSSYASHRTSSPHRAGVPTLRHASAAQQRATSTTPNSGPASGRFSSLSGMFRSPSALRGSFSSRRSRVSVQDTFAAPDEASTEDLRRVIEQQEREASRFELENVRACCDGKHDVGSLSKKGRHGNHSGRLSAADSGSRSHSRAESYGARSRHSHLQPESGEEEQGPAGH